MEFSSLGLSELLLFSLFAASCGSMESHHCPSPTSSQPLSLCAFCSDTHAGVRWIAHKPDIRFIKSLSFTCTDERGNRLAVGDDDPCFGGSNNNIPSPITIDESGRVHMISTDLPLGTTCTFTAEYYDDDLELRDPVFANCSIKSTSQCSNDPEECHLPANCSVSGETDSCQCLCTEGYAYTAHLGGSGIVCDNIDECSEEPSPCSDDAECSDTEGSYSCTCVASDSHNGLNSTQCFRLRDNISTAHAPSGPTVTSIPLIESSSVTTELSSSTQVEMMTTVATSSITMIGYLQPTARITDTSFSNKKDTRMILVVGSLVAVLLVLLCGGALAVLSGVSLRSYKMRNRRIKLLSPQISIASNEFDPEFCPAVNIEKRRTIERSVYSILHALEQERNTTHVVVGNTMICKDEESNSSGDTRSEILCENSYNSDHESDDGTDSCCTSTNPEGHEGVQQSFEMSLIESEDPLHEGTQKVSELEFKPLTWRTHEQHSQEYTASSPSATSGYVTQSSVESSLTSTSSPLTDGAYERHEPQSDVLQLDSAPYIRCGYVSYPRGYIDNGKDSEIHVLPDFNELEIEDGYISDYGGECITKPQVYSTDDVVLTEQSNEHDLDLEGMMHLEMTESGTHLSCDDGTQPEELLSVDSESTIHFNFPTIYSATTGDLDLDCL